MQIDQKQFKTLIDAMSKFRSLKTTGSRRKLSLFKHPTPLDTLKSWNRENNNASMAPKGNYCPS